MLKSRGRVTLAAQVQARQGIVRGAQQSSVRYAFLRHVNIAQTMIKLKPQQRLEFLAETFDIGQLAQVSSAASAVARMGARFATGDDALAETVRAYQDAVERWQRLDARLVKAASEPPDR